MLDHSLNLFQLAAFNIVFKFESTNPFIFLKFLNIQQPKQIEVPAESPIVDLIVPEYVHLKLSPYPGTLSHLVADLQIVLLEKDPLHIEGSKASDNQSFPLPPSLTVEVILAVELSDVVAQTEIQEGI